MSFKEIKPDIWNDNAFKAIGDDWMLVSAGTKEKFNTMTASWGGVGILWGRPVAFVFIRPQRYTFEFCEAGDKLTLSFFGGEEREALKLCGSKSGRDCDKVAEAGLESVWCGDGYVTFTSAHTVLECRKLYADMIKPECMVDSSLMANYKSGDFHKMYILEIERVLVKE